MEFRIADTFTDSLGRLTAQEQKAAKTTAFDLQLDPTSNGLSFHKLDRAKDSNFWSVRVTVMQLSECAGLPWADQAGVVFGAPN